MALLIFIAACLYLGFGAMIAIDTLAKGEAAASTKWGELRILLWIATMWGPLLLIGAVVKWWQKKR